jgi:hypothetical protein
MHDKDDSACASNPCSQISDAAILHPTLHNNWGAGYAAGERIQEEIFDR